ncbi:hypothetical protein [Saccharothrix australiensis]|uniref:hypothetical protein n=1 Tax=Saccharothrix australiensis TaxID=2072 RepID=UPI0011C4776B|nr:hypothetical protein [Saccharothrix australiensis]
MGFQHPVGVAPGGRAPGTGSGPRLEAAELWTAADFDDEVRIDHQTGRDWAKFTFPGGQVELTFSEHALTKMIAAGQEALDAMRAAEAR